jgi:hypothetical protein
VSFGPHIRWRSSSCSSSRTRALRSALTFDFAVLVAGHNTRLGNRKDGLIQKQYMQDIMTFTEEIMNDPNMLTYRPYGSTSPSARRIFCMARQASRLVSSPGLAWRGSVSLRFCSGSC